MRNFAAIAVFVSATIGVFFSARVEAVEFGCRIGKTDYCFKYGQMFCIRENRLAAREKACVEWTAACLACHGRIPECLNGKRPTSSSPLCQACGAEWRDCMHAIDAAYWPNRRKLSEEKEEPETPADDAE